MARRDLPESKDRRGEILAAATRVVLRDGLDGIRSQAVASEAGVSVALPHYYYPTLPDLVRAIWERVDAAEQEREAALLSPEGAPVERLRTFMLGAFAGPDRAVRERWMMRTEFQRRAVFDRDLADEVVAAERRRIAALEAAIVALQAAGDAPAAADPSLIAARIAGALDGFGVMLLVDLVSPGSASACLERLVAGRGNWERPREHALPVLPPMPARDPNRREVILDATIRLIARAGIAGMHFPEVAVEADVSRSLPRYYFPTLGDLLRATLARDEETARARVEWRAAHLDDPLDRLRDAYAHAIAANPEDLRPTWVLWFEYLRIAARDQVERRRANARLAAWIAYDSTNLRALRQAGRIAETVDIDDVEQRLLAIDNGTGALWMLGVLTPQRYAAVVDAAIDDELGTG